jgi:hypothetical protein
MTIFWSRSLKGVHGTWKTPGFAFLAPLLVELQPTLGVIFGIIAVFRGPQRGTWGPHGRPLALSLPFGMSRPGLAPIWSQFNPRSQPRGGPKTVKIVICDKTHFFPNRPFRRPGPYHDARRARGGTNAPTEPPRSGLGRIPPPHSTKRPQRPLFSIVYVCRCVVVWLLWSVSRPEDQGRAPSLVTTAGRPCGRCGPGLSSCSSQYCPRAPSSPSRISRYL